MSRTSEIVPPRPLSALLSQVLVAFTVEVDNEFERQMGAAGHIGARLSMVVWTNLVRFIGERGASVRDLSARALAPRTQVKFQLGCLERWGFIALGEAARGTRREGWGSGRGIRDDSAVHLTSKAVTASRIWTPLFDKSEPGEIERRWEKRFGKGRIAGLKQALKEIESQLDVQLPDGLPPGWETASSYSPRTGREDESISLPTLLSRLLLAFRIEFERDSTVPLVYCANILRVLGEEPIRVSEIPRLTGSSPETTAIGWQMKPYVEVMPDPAASCGKVARLSPRGLRVQGAYNTLTGEIETRWEKRYGKKLIGTLRESLEGLFELRKDGAALLSEGLIPPPGTARAGDQGPALGRRDVGPAARQRMRDLVAQTEAFVRDPAASLPHHPSWDMNRGFGP